MNARRGVSRVEREDMALGRAVRRLGPEMAATVELLVMAISELEPKVCADCGEPLGEARMLCAESSPDRESFVVKFVGPDCSAAHGQGWVERTH